MTEPQRATPTPVDVQPLTPAQAYAALTKLVPHTWRYADDPTNQRYAGPMLPELVDDPLLATLVQHDPDGTPMGWFQQSMIGMCVAALPAVKANLDEQVAALAPLQRVAASFPSIVAHSDEVHDALTQGQTAIGQAVAAVQAAAQSLTTSLGSISQIAAQAYASSAIANTKITALEARVAALEARRVQAWRATGNLPALAVNATTTTLCPWQTVPSPLPTPDQCTVIQVAGNAATLTPTAVSAAGVTVQVRSVNVLLAASNALQVVATTW